jgi:hypothetical protein
MTLDMCILLVVFTAAVCAPIVMLILHETFEHLDDLTPVRELVEPWSPFEEVRKYWNLVPYTDEDMIPTGLRAA